MEEADSVLNPVAVAQIRALLKPRRQPKRMWPTVAAAALLAASSLGLAWSMLFAPPVWDPPPIAPVSAPAP